MSRVIVFLGAALVLAGCGGGGSPAPAGTGGGGGTVVAGPVQIEGSVSQPQVAASGSGNVTSYAIQGNIAKATIMDTSPSAEEAEVVVSRFGPLGYEIVACNPDGSGLRSLVTVVSFTPTDVKVSPDGLYVYFIYNNVLQRVPIGGGVRTSILSGVQGFVFTPSGAKLVLRRNNTEIWTANANGTSPTLVCNYVTEAMKPAGCMSETRALFTGLHNVYAMDLTPGSSPFTPVIYFSNLSIQSTTFHRPSSSLYVFLYDSNASKYRIDRIGVTDSFGFAVDNLSLDAPSTYSLAVAPDGASMIGIQGKAVRRTQTNLNAYGTVLMPGSYNSVCWRPVPASRPIVGPSSTFTGGAGALIFSEQLSRMPVYVLADATTRGSMAVTILNQGAGNMVYDVSCDQLTKLYAATANGYIPTALVNNTSSGLKGAILSFDGYSGNLATVVTYNKKPVLDRRPGSVRLGGDGIVGVYDATGKELPHGASVVLQ